MLKFSFAFPQVQDTLNFQVVDKYSYALYEEKKWNELEHFCKKAIEKNYDYYYLRLRAGIALYEQKKYRGAINHFKKALTFNSYDDLAYEYIYYCYLYSNRPEDARQLSKQFNAELATRLKTDNLNPMNDITIEAGNKLSDSINLFKPASFGQITLNHYVNKSILLTHAFNFYLQNESRFNVAQTQYYIRADVPLNKELNFTAATHLIYDQTGLTQTVVTTFTVQDPAPRPGAPLPPVRSLSSASVNEVAEQSLGLAGAVSVTKHFSIADINAGVSALFLDTVKQAQLNTGLVIYPLQNNNLILGVNTSLHSNDKTKKTGFAFSPFLNVKVYKGFYVLLHYFSNNGLNVTEQNSQYINNSYDYTLNRFGISPSYYFSKKLSAYGSFCVEEKKNITQNFIYHYTIFSVGLRLNPFKNN